MGKLSKIALILIKLFNTGTARTAKPGVGNMKNKLIYESMMTSKPKQCNLVPTILFPEFTLFLSVPRSTTSQRIMTISTCLSDLLRENWLKNCDNTDRSDSGVTLSDDECLWVTLGVITVSHQSWETVTTFFWQLDWMLSFGKYWVQLSRWNFDENFMHEKLAWCLLEIHWYQLEHCRCCPWGFFHIILHWCHWHFWCRSALQKCHWCRFLPLISIGIVPNWYHARVHECF